MTPSGNTVQAMLILEEVVVAAEVALGEVLMLSFSRPHQIHFLKGEMFQLKLMGDDCLFPAAHKSGCSAISNIPGKEAGDFLSMF